MKNCLIIGNGRAGKRHVRDAKLFGLQTTTVDPYAPADLPDWKAALWQQHWDYVVIASPPDAHLEQLLACIECKIPTLCEKPLCSLHEDIGRLEGVTAPVMIAYNWQYNSVVQELRQQGLQNQYTLYSIQQRELPPWGLLLDHVSHDLSIIQHVSGGIVEITEAWLEKADTMHAWVILGRTVGGRPFEIIETVVTHPVERITGINGTDLLLPANTMFARMWQGFLEGNYQPSLQDGITIQKWLDRIDRMQKDALEKSNKRVRDYYKGGTNGLVSGT